MHNSQLDTRFAPNRVDLLTVKNEIDKNRQYYEIYKSFNVEE